MEFKSNPQNNFSKKFIIIGTTNTVFGYLVGILNYFLLFEVIGIIGVGILNNIINISFAFIMLKKFVFKTINTNWFYEYLRSYLVYGLKAIIGIFILWLCVSTFKLNIFISQAAAMLITIFVSYKGHKNFTFKINN